MARSRWLTRVLFGGGTALALACTVALIVVLTLLSLLPAPRTRINAAAVTNASAPPPPAATPACKTTSTGACVPGTIAYSHSWYISNPADIPVLAKGDAQWLNTESAKTNCSGDFLTVLDFGHPTTKYSGNASPLDNYAMTLFAHKSGWQTYRQVERLAEKYLDVWYATASKCPHLRLALGTSNYAECAQAVGHCDVATAGKQWDIMVHDVMSYVAAKGYGNKILGVWVGDDLEGSWDPWPTTHAFLEAVSAQEKTYSTHAHLIDYGDANAGACSEVTGDCGSPWTSANVFSAAWGIGWNLPLPETYTPHTTQKWLNVNSKVGSMDFVGVMTECSGADPLPVGNCWVSFGSGGECQFSPAVGYAHLQPADLRHTLVYATNMQWAHQQDTKHHC